MRLIQHRADQNQTATLCSSIDPWHSESDIDTHGDQTGLALFFTSGITNNSTNAQVINFGLKLVSPVNSQTFAATGNLTFNGPVTLGSNAMTITGAGTTLFTGGISSTSGDIVKTGAGTLTNGFAVNAGTLAIGGTYTSPTNSVASGATLNVLSSGALTGDVTTASGATTIVNGTVTGNIANAGALSGTGTVARSLRALLPLSLPRRADQLLCALHLPPPWPVL